MSLFQQRPQTSDPTMFYTIGMNKQVLIAGLGNPGEKYVQTRHNAGFMGLDEFVAGTEEMSEWIEKKDWKCHISQGTVNGLGVLAVKPMTMMNDSGAAIQAVAHFYKINAKHVVVAHDELDIDFGKIRTRQGGSDAGHRGIRSVSQHLDENYGRIRIGVGPKQPPQIDSVDFVLQNFSAAEQAQLPNMRREVSAIIHEYLAGGELPNETRSFLV